jgi:hypothetical protein
MIDPARLLMLGGIIEKPSRDLREFPGRRVEILRQPVVYRRSCHLVMDSSKGFYRQWRRLVASHLRVESQEPGDTPMHRLHLLAVNPFRT